MKTPHTYQTGVGNSEEYVLQVHLNFLVVLELFDLLRVKTRSDMNYIFLKLGTKLQYDME